METNQNNDSEEISEFLDTNALHPPLFDPAGVHQSVAFDSNSSSEPFLGTIAYSRLNVFLHLVIIKSLVSLDESCIEFTPIDREDIVSIEHYVTLRNNTVLILPGSIECLFPLTNNNTVDSTSI